MMQDLLMQLADTTARLEGATAVNVLLLHKLGGQITIDRHELATCNEDFDDVSYSVSDNQLTIKLRSSDKVEKGAL